MWVIEINVAGHQFTRRVPDSRRHFFGLSTRGVNWRHSQSRQHAA
jgi:hypothetical protein